MASLLFPQWHSIGHLNIMRCIWAVLIILLWEISAVVSRYNEAKPKLVCYYASWANYRRDNGSFGAGDINPRLCTHIIYAYAGLGDDLGIVSMDRHLTDDRDDFKKFVEVRKFNPDLFLMVGIGGYGNDRAEKFSRMAARQESRQFFITSVVTFMNTYKFDGLSIDWIWPGGGGNRADKQNFVALLKELKQAFLPRWILSIFGPGIEHQLDQGYDVQGIAKYVDFVSLQTYDYHGVWDGKTGLIAQQYPRKNDYGNLNQDYTVNMWIAKGIAASKLIMSIPTFGRSYTLLDPRKNRIGDKITGPGDKGPYTSENGLLGYNELVEKFKTIQPWIDIWEDDAEGLFSYPAAVYSANFWISYVEPISAGYKANYTLKKGLGGAMIYSLDTDDYRGVSGTRFPIINAIKNIFDSSLPEWVPSTRNSRYPITNAVKKDFDSRTPLPTWTPPK